MHTGPTPTHPSVRAIVDQAVAVTGSRSRRQFAIRYGIPYRSLSRAYRVNRLTGWQLAYLTYLAIGAGLPLKSGGLDKLSEVCRKVA